MAQLYTLVPRPEGPFQGLDPVSRMVFGAIWDRYRLSSYSVTGGDGSWFDPREQAVFCVFTQQELAQLVGVSERTIRRSLDMLAADNLIWWRKATYKGANRYFIHAGIVEYLKPQCQ